MKKIALTFGFILLCLYSTAWVMSVSIYTNFAKSITSQTGITSSITGFPFAPRLLLSGDYVLKNESKISSSELIISGFPFPAQTIRVLAPQGINFRSSLWVSDISFDKLDMAFQIPLRIPHSNLKTDWMAWQASGDSIHIDYLNMMIDDFSVDGSNGTMQLDPTLQWVGSMTVRLTGADQFIMTLSEQGLIPPQAALSAASFLQFLTRTDEQTGERFIQTSAQIRNNQLFIGPIPVTDIPSLNLQ